MSKKVNVTVEGFVYLPVKVKLDLLIRTDTDRIDRVVAKWAKGQWNGADADVENVDVESAEIYGLLDQDESLESQVEEHLSSGGQNVKVTINHFQVTDSR